MRHDDFGSLKAYSERSFGVYQEDPFKAVWKFDAEVADDVRDHLFHPTQVLEEQPDGSVIVSFEAAGWKEMCWHLFTWDGSVEFWSLPIKEQYTELTHRVMKRLGIEAGIHRLSAPIFQITSGLKGLQCGKALWLYRHRKDLAPEITPEKQALFDTGHEIGELAMRYFGEGVEVTNEYWDVMGAVEATEQYIKVGHDIIFEATAVHPVNGCYSRIDILKRVEGSDEWDLIEVKSSTQVKDYHIDDMSFQYHVFYGAGYRIRKCFMMVIDAARYCPER